MKFRTQTFITKTSFQKHYNDNVREIVVMATSRMFTFAMQHVKVCSSVTVARYEHTVICNLVFVGTGVKSLTLVKIVTSLCMQHIW